jgi:hypothetical protein
MCRTSLECSDGIPEEHVRRGYYPIVQEGRILRDCAASVVVEVALCRRVSEAPCQEDWGREDEECHTDVTSYHASECSDEIVDHSWSGATNSVCNTNAIHTCSVS